MDAQERHPHDRLTPDEARLLEAARRRGLRPLLLALDRARPGAVSALGGPATASEETIRFSHDPALALSTADVVSVREVERPGAGGAAPVRPVLQVTTTFLGLTGEVSPLPPYMAEEVAREVAHDERPRRRDFLDIFHHRALSFLCRAVAKHDLPGAARSDLDDDWPRRLLALLGRDVAAAATDAEDGLPRWALLRCAPVLAERALTAAALEACLAALFAEELGDAAVEVEQFVGGWVPLAVDERTRLGASATELGRSFVLGARVFDRACRSRIVVGPLDAAGYTRFSAPERVRRIRAAAVALSGGDLEFEIVLRLLPGAAPGLALSSSGGHRLGRDTWLGRQGSEARLKVDGGLGARAIAVRAGEEG
jgi:type VI secretion system protein ImpH